MIVLVSFAVSAPPWTGDKPAHHEHLEKEKSNFRRRREYMPVVA